MRQLTASNQPVLSLTKQQLFSWKLLTVVLRPPLLLISRRGQEPVQLGLHRRVPGLEPHERPLDLAVCAQTFLPPTAPLFSGGAKTASNGTEALC